MLTTFIFIALLLLLSGIYTELRQLRRALEQISQKMPKSEL